MCKAVLGGLAQRVLLEGAFCTWDSHKNGPKYVPEWPDRPMTPLSFGGRFARNPRGADHPPTPPSHRLRAGTTPT